MPLFKKNDSEAVQAEGTDTSEHNQRIEFLTGSLQHLLVTTQELINELKEKELETLTQITKTVMEEVNPVQKIKQSQKSFEKYKKQIKELIKIHKTTIKDKEKELRDIISILTKAISTFDNENKSYYQSVYQQSEKLDQLRQLDDIREIKKNLKDEVTSLRSNLENKKKQDHQSLIKLSDQVEILKEQLAKVKEENQFDALTGAYNRQAYDTKILELIDNAQANRKSFSLIAFDIDHFKSINDKHGHQYGDRALLAVVTQCRQYIREEDIIARYGGDEFVIILPNSSLKIGIKKAQTICSAVAATKYIAGEGLPPIDLTISMGVSAFKKGDTVESIFDRADKALYITKQKGRNGVYSEKNI